MGQLLYSWRQQSVPMSSVGTDDGCDRCRQNVIFIICVCHLYRKCPTTANTYMTNCWYVETVDGKTSAQSCRYRQETDNKTKERNKKERRKEKREWKEKRKEKERKKKRMREERK